MDVPSDKIKKRGECRFSLSMRHRLGAHHLGIDDTSAEGIAQGLRVLFFQHIRHFSDCNGIYENFLRHGLAGATVGFLDA
jgi:hypothetical protein